MKEAATTDEGGEGGRRICSIRGRGLLLRTHEGEGGCY